MPKIVQARAALDEQEERWVRKMAASRHGPADWIVHAKMVVHSWDGEKVETIAQQLSCSPPTVRRRLHRFDVEGTLGLGDRPRTGRPRCLTAEEDSRILALARSAPPGKLKRLSSGELDPLHLDGRRVDIASKPRWSTVGGWKRRGFTGRCGCAMARRSPVVPLRATLPIPSSY